MDWVSEIVKFFNYSFFSIVGGVSTLLMMGGFLYGVWVIFNGVFPVWYRLGKGLSSGKITIFSKVHSNSLKVMISDSGIFKGNNIFLVDSVYDISRGEGSNILLMHWKDFEHSLDDILSVKKDHMALIVYAPTEEERISEETMAKIARHRNSIVVNFRGRLLNDILVSLITVSYECK